MKLTALLFLLVFPLLMMAQGYQLSKADLSGKIKKSDKTLDLSQNSNWKTDAKIIFTGLDASDYGKIAVRLAGQTQAIPAEPYANDGKAVFILSKVIATENKDCSFSITYNNVDKGIVSFNVTPAAGAKSKDFADDDSGDDDAMFQGYVGALASANIIGDGNFLSGLTPIINLGGITTIVPKNGNGRTNLINWDLDINPYLGASISMKDSISYLPGLMLPGRAGISINNYLNMEFGDYKITLMPLGFGLKAIPGYMDSTVTLIQHNIRFGASVLISNTFMISGQLTHGWHNFTSKSEQNYKNVFGNSSTDITYLTVTMQAAIRGKKGEVTNYVYIEWRNLLSKDHYSAFDNNRFFTIGIRKTLELGNGGPFAAKSGSRSGAGKHVVHSTF